MNFEKNNQPKNPMKRDLDLIRDILLAIEAEPAGKLIRTIPLPSKWTKEEAIGHLRLIKDAGLTDGKIDFHGDQLLMAIHGLSNRGHDLLDSIRNETVWQQTKDKVEEVGGSVGLDVVKAIAGAILGKMLGLG